MSTNFTMDTIIKVEASLCIKCDACIRCCPGTWGPNAVEQVTPPGGWQDPCVTIE